MWSGLVGIVSKYEEWGSSGPGRSDMCLVCLSYSIACVQYGMWPVWGVSVWGVSVCGPAVTRCRRTLRSFDDREPTTKNILNLCSVCATKDKMIKL